MFGRKELERRIDEQNERLNKQQERIEELLQEVIRRDDIEGIISRAILTVNVRERQEQPSPLEQVKFEEAEETEEFKQIIKRAGLVPRKRWLSNNSLVGVSTVERLYTIHGGQHVEQIFYIIKESLGYRQSTTTTTFIMIISRFIKSFHGNKNYDQEKLIRTIREVGVSEIMNHYYVEGHTKGKKSLIESSNFLLKEYNKRCNNANERIL